MSGFLGFGANAGEKRASSKLDSVFSYGLGMGESGQRAGQSVLSDPTAYFKSLLAPGRTTATANAAPVINAAQAQSDTARREEAATGTSRGGGTAGANREAGTATAKTIDDIINESMVGGRREAAAGLTQIGGTELANATNLLGLGSSAEESVLNDAQLQSQRQAEMGAAIGGLLGKALFQPKSSED